jgi:predicted nucleotidyltransferase
MERSETLRRLRDHEAELRRLGVERLSLFGSLARGQDGQLSDVDVAVRLSDELRGFNRLRQLDALRVHLEALLRTTVDVVEEPVPSSRVQQEIDRDRVLAF